MGSSDVRRAYNVGAVKIDPELRDVAHAVITEQDDRGFINIIGAGDVPDDEDGGDGPHDHTQPLGADVCYRVWLTDAEAAQFRAASNCRYVELDGQARATAASMQIPSATTLAYMKAMFRRANTLWHGRDVTVAVADGGTTAAVRTFMGWTLVARQDFSADLVGSDEITNQHGCLVAPNAVPYGGRIIDAIIAENNGGADFSRSAQGIRWAADQGAQVVNYSYSAATDDPTIPSVLSDAAQYLKDRGVQWFISMGNDGKNRFNPPANLSLTFSNVHSSIAFDENTDARASFSNYHKDASGSAPGANVLSLGPDATVQTWNGTSASTPHMAQLCARGCTGARYTAAQVGAALKSYTRNTGQTADQQGHGAYSLEAALTGLGAFATPLAAGAERNLCLNPSAEANLTGYDVAVRAGITATVPATAAGITPSAGAKYGFTNVTGDGTTSASADATVTFPSVAVTAGSAYTFQADLRHAALGVSAAWFITWRNSAGTQLSTTQGSAQKLWVTEWVRYWHTATAPATAATADVQILLTGVTDTTTRSFRWDAVRYAASSTVGDYFDGSYAGASWDGIASNSASTLEAVVAAGTTPVTPPDPVPATLAPIPSVTDGVMVSAADLAGITDAYRYLYSIVHGGFRDHRAAVRLGYTATQTVASGASVLMSWGNEAVDTDGMWTIGTPTQIVCRLDGVYQIGATTALVASSATAGAQAQLRITKNATTNAGTIARGSAAYSAGAGCGVTAQATVPLVAGDVLRVYVTQNSGSSTTTDLTFGSARAWAYWLGPQATSTDAPATPPPPVVVTPPPTTGTEAASLLGWGPVVDGDEFSTGTQPGAKWGMYNGAGHSGNGTRSPSAWSISGGVCTVSGSASTVSGGMAYKSGGMYVRVEIRMRTYSVNPAASGNRYHPVLLMWPNSERWPQDGELDFFETDCDTGKFGWFMHYPQAPVKQEGGSIAKDIQNWHNYGFEWSSGGLRGWVDGVQAFQYTQASIQPPGPMHLCIQLDAFNSSGQTPAKMDVDWVRFYTPPG